MWTPGAHTSGDRLPPLKLEGVMSDPIDKAIKNAERVPIAMLTINIKIEGTGRMAQVIVPKDMIMGEVLELSSWFPMGLVIELEKAANPASRIILPTVKPPMMDKPQ